LARFLALDWDHNQLHLVEATVAGGVVRVVRAAVWQEQQNPNPAEAEALGQLLRERMKAARISPAPVLVCVGRDRVILKDVRFPPVPEAEEPALVRFQAVKELSDAPEEVVIDYTVTAPGGDGRDRQALALIVRKELLGAYQTLCKAAGLKLAGLTPRPFGSLACLRRVAGTTVLTPAPEPAGAPVALVTVTEKWAEFCVARGDGMDALVLTRNLASGPNLAGEIRRNLAVYAGGAGQQPVQALYLSGGEHLHLRERLQDMLGIPVHVLDPFGGSEQPDLPTTGRAGFVGPVGLLHAQAERRGLPIDFTRPKQPRPPSDPNKRRLVFLGAAVAAVLLGVVGYCYYQLDVADRELERLVLEKTNLDRDLTGLDEDARRIAALDGWAANEIPVLDELYDLAARFPDPNTLRLVRLTLNPVPRTARTVGKSYSARMELTGITRDDSQPVNDLMAELVKDGHYNVKPKELTRNSTGQDRFSGFSQQFKLPVDVEKVGPEKYHRRLNAVPPPRKRETEGQGFDMGFPDMGGQQ
jgi:Tfp pilus assembly PilM family ATPase